MNGQGAGVDPTCIRDFAFPYCTRFDWTDKTPSADGKALQHATTVLSTTCLIQCIVRSSLFREFCSHNHTSVGHLLQTREGWQWVERGARVCNRAMRHHHRVTVLCTLSL